LKTLSNEEITNLIKEVLQRLLQDRQFKLPDGSNRGESPDTTHSCSRNLITEEIVKKLPSYITSLQVKPKVIITPSARDELYRRKINVIRTELTNSPQKIPTPQEKVKRVAIGADHGGLEMKNELAKYVESLGYEVNDVGTYSTDSVDYPDFAEKVGKAVQSGACQCGIMVDGAGIGSSMVLNKMKGIRAAVCHDIYTVKNSREHNGANALCLGGGVIGIGLAKEMVKVWLETEFGGGRHQRRVDKIMKIENRQ